MALTLRLSDQSDMSRLQEFVAERLKETGQNPFEAARRVSLENTFIDDILRGRKAAVNARNVAKLAAALHTNAAAVMAAMDDQAPATARSAAPSRRRGEVVTARVGVPELSALPRDVPVFGVASAAVVPGGPRGSRVEGAFVVDPTKPVDFVSRPPALSGASDAYAVYVQGESMAPMHQAGDLRVAHPHRPVRPGDTVIVQVRETPTAQINGFIKIFVARDSRWVTTRQLKPEGTVKFAAETVVAVHRVLTTAELLGG